MHDLIIIKTAKTTLIVANVQKIFSETFLNETFCISIQSLLMCVLWRQVDNEPPLVLLTHFPTGAANMRQWTGLPLFQVMACRQFGAKP